MAILGVLPCSVRCIMIFLGLSSAKYLNVLFFFFGQVHNRNLLSMDFDRITRTEKVYDDHRKFTLRIHYDHAGRPTLWAPSNRLNGVNVTYSPGGHVAGIQRGTMSIRMEYDQNGRITSQIFADGKSWSYTYLEKVNSFKLLVVTNLIIILLYRRVTKIAQDPFTPFLFVGVVQYYRVLTWQFNCLMHSAHIMHC